MSHEGAIKKNEASDEINPSEVLHVVKENQVWIDPLELRKLTDMGMGEDEARTYLEEKAEFGTTTKQSRVDKIKEKHFSKTPRTDREPVGAEEKENRIENTAEKPEETERIELVRLEIERKLGGKNGDGGGNEKKPETNIAEQFEKKFGISKEEFATLEKNEDFKNLSHGQRLFVLKNLEQVSLDKTIEEGQMRFEDTTKKKGIFGKIVSNLTKEGRIASHKKDIAKQLQTGGLYTHKETIDQLTNRAMMMNVPMIENARGELEMQFGKVSEKMTPEERVLVQAYNKSATEFAFTPHEWDGFRGGSGKENKKYDNKKIAFYESLEKYSSLAGKYDLPHDPSVLRKINLQQFLTTHPDAEKVMNELAGNANTWKRTFGKDILVERGVYGAVGYAARGMAPLVTAAQVGAPIASFVIGSIRGGLRASKTLRTRERRARRGVEDGSTTAKNFVDAFSDSKEGVDGKKVRSMGERLEELTQAYESAQTEEQQKLIAQQLFNRSQYTLRKMNDGLINFGNADMRIFNQTRLMDVIAKAECYAAANGEAGAEVKKRVDHFLNIRGNRIDSKQDWYIAKEAVKAGVFGAGFATAGILAKDIGHEIKDMFTSHSSTHGIDVPKIKLRSGEIPLAGHKIPKYTPGDHHLRAGDTSHFEEPKAPNYAPNDQTNTAPTHLAPPKAYDPSAPRIPGRNGEIPLAEHEVPEYKGGGGTQSNIDNSGFEEPKAPTDYAPADKTRVAIDDPRFKITGPAQPDAPIPGTAPVPPYAEGYEVKPIEVKFEHGHGAIATFKELQEKLVAEYKGVDASKIPPSVKEIIDGDPTKLAQKFGFYDPSSQAESALVIKGSSLSIGENGNLDYNSIRDNTHQILEFADGEKGYNYNEKMFDYDGHHSIAAVHAQRGGTTIDGEEIDENDYVTTDTPADTHQFDAHTTPKVIHEHDAAKVATEKEIKEPLVKQFKSWDGHPRQTSAGHYNTVGKESYRTSAGGGAMNGQVYNPATGRWEGAGANPQAPDNNWYRTGGGRYYSPNDPNRPIYNYSGHDINPNNRIIDPTPHTPEDTIDTTMKFSGQTNRQYHKLLEDVFGDKEPVTGDATYNEEILKMFKEHSAVDDIDSTADVGDTKDMQNYYRIVKQIHESSGLEPKDTDTTGLYIKEALEKMKHDGINIRRFVNALVKNKGVENFADTASNISPAHEVSISEDDVYQ